LVDGTELSDVTDSRASFVARRFLVWAGMVREVEVWGRGSVSVEEADDVVLE
jgi:hypothetical protein